jgi:hypothetical protein
MLALQLTDPTAVGPVAFVLSLVLGPVLVAGVLTAPLLLSARLRRLFEGLPPTGYASVSFGLTVLALYVPWVLLFVIAISEPASQTSSIAAVLGLPGLAMLYTIGFSLGAVRYLPRVGLDWYERDDRLTSWLLALCWSTLYTAPIALPFFFFAMIARLPTG